MRPTATFFITTARSATQWLATSLGDAYPDRLVVEHEPIGYAYAPCETLRDREAGAAKAAEPGIAAHLERIRGLLAKGRSYVEVGFPAFAMIPALRDAFGEQLRVVQLTRDPVRVAASLVTHEWYVGEGRENVRGLVALTPFDPGVRMKSYADRWSGMTAFEKGLFYWAEVHKWGLEVEAGIPPERFARFRAEDLLDEDRAERLRLAEFLDLPDRAEWRDAQSRTVDNFRATTAEIIDPRMLNWHPEIAALARRLGYAEPHSDAATLARRYSPAPGRRIMRSAKRIVRQMATIFFG
jgi:hypothetical protein